MERIKTIIFIDMRYIFLILFCLLVSCDGGEVSFEVIDNKDECHSCPGSLVVKKNNMVDTIKTGSWGKTSDNYSVVKILNKDYVVLKTSRFGMGILVIWPKLTGLHTII